MSVVTDVFHCVLLYKGSWDVFFEIQLWEDI